jgi:thiol-disulfide isomerase/thioredoxin
MLTGENKMPGQSYAGTYRAVEFPQGLDWFNTGRPLTIRELKGKVVILDFWTYGCINCMHAIPDLKKLEDEYPEELVVIGVHSAKFTNEGDSDNLRKIILRYGLKHPVVNDREFKVWNRWGVRAWPTLIIIDPAGMVSGLHSGEGVYALFKPVIESLVAEFDARGLLDRNPLNLKLEEGEAVTGLLFPGKVLADEAGGRLFISDSGHNRVLVTGLKTGQILEEIGTGQPGMADGSFKAAAFRNPQGTALSSNGKLLYIADTDNHAIRTIDLGCRTVSTLAGDGKQTSAYPMGEGKLPGIELNSPWDVELIGNNLYIAMAGAHQLCRIDLDEGYLRTFAGSGREGVADGPLSFAELAQPSGLAYDGKGRLYFADAEGSSIRWADINDARPEVHTLAGSGFSLFDFGDKDGRGNKARFQHALGVAWYNGRLYVADTYNHKIKSINPETGDVNTLAGGSKDTCNLDGACFYEPGGLSTAGDNLYIADTNNHIIREFDLVTHKASVIQI